MKYKILTLIFLLFFSSCDREEFLGIEPRGIVIPSTIADFRSLLDQVRVVPGSNPLSTGLAPSHTISTYMTDDQDLINESATAIVLSRAEINAYTFENNIYIGSEADLDWNNYYNQIYTANVVLDGLNTVTDGSASDIAQLAAEARLHRAYAYFNLVNLYGVHYDPSTAQTDLGVPIREGISLEAQFARNTVQEIYDLILTDIIESRDDLEVVQNIQFTFRPSQAGADGLLAKVYLYQAEYQLALDAANRALSANNVLRNINFDETANSNFPNLITQPSPIEDTQIIWYKLINNFTPTHTSVDLIDSYEVNDSRLNWYLSLDENLGLTGIDGLSLATSLESNQPLTTTGITTPDMWLVVAETSARLGNIPAANNALNTLRMNRFATGTFTPINLTDATELLNFVKAERRRELVGTVQRTFDIKRYNRFDNDGINLTHNLFGQGRTLEANSPDWALPIAQSLLQLNPILVPNSRQ